MTLTLYRVNTAGQGLGNLDANNEIIFNATTDVEVLNAFITQVDIQNTTGIGNNQAAEQDLGDHQDLGSVEQLYTITGFISKRDSTPDVTNTIDILKKWFSANSLICSASACVSPAAHIKPSVPSSIKSGPAVFFVVNIGSPDAIASRMTRPNPSNNDGKTKTSAD